MSIYDAIANSGRNVGAGLNAYARGKYAVDQREQQNALLAEEQKYQRDRQAQADKQNALSQQQEMNQQQVEFLQALRADMEATPPEARDARLQMWAGDAQTLGFQLEPNIRQMIDQAIPYQPASDEAYFEGTGMENQAANNYILSLPPDQRPAAVAELSRQRLQRETSTATPLGVIINPGYNLNALNGAQPSANQRPSASGQLGTPGGSYMIEKPGANLTPAEQAAEVEQAKATVKAKEQWPDVEEGYRQYVETSAVLEETIQEAIDKASGVNVGVLGESLKGVPQTSQYDYAQLLNTIKANIGFDKLQAMRDASPTGGALGQVSELENRLLQAVQGSLDQGQRPETLKKNLRNILKLHNQLQESKRRAYEKDKQRFGGSPKNDVVDEDPLGLL